MSKPLLLLLLSTLPIPPPLPLTSFNPASLQWPITLTLQPFSPLHLSSHIPLPQIRLLDVSRSIERLAFAWAALGFLNAILRTGQRLYYRHNNQEQKVKVRGMDSKSIILERPFLVALVLHFLAYRLLSVSMEKGMVKGGWGWPLDLTSLIGVGTGLIATWGEIGRFLRLFGWNRDPDTGPSWTLSIVHVILSAHRLALSIGIISAALANGGMSGFIKGQTTRSGGSAFI